MPIPTPFHPRTAALCESLLWKEWAGYYSVRSFTPGHEREYFAIRHAAGMIDVTPLYKYDVHGPDAAAFLDRIMIRNIPRLKVGQVAYLCWCDDGGHVIDDGTVSRLDDEYFRVTSTETNYHWFIRHAGDFDVTVEDSTARIGGLAVQGPNARGVVSAATGGDAESLGFFKLIRTRIDGVDVVVSRTGYTGDLGFEVWVDNDHAVAVWDALMAAGRPWGLEPAGLDAMDVTRIEAGFILNGIDYFNALHCMIEPRKASPFELALDWAVHLKHAAVTPFIGSEALTREKARGPKRNFVGLEMDWDEYEDLFREHGLPPEVHSGGWRDGRPVYDLDGRFIGQATSGAWSPLLKTNLALATIEAGQAQVGNTVLFEVTVEYERRTVRATVVNKPFFDPERKRS
jgi:aminomethyltransferase